MFFPCSSKFLFVGCWAYWINFLVVLFFVFCFLSLYFLVFLLEEFLYYLCSSVSAMIYIYIIFKGSFLLSLFLFEYSFLYIIFFYEYNIFSYLSEILIIVFDAFFSVLPAFLQFLYPGCRLSSVICPGTVIKACSSHGRSLEHKIPGPTCIFKGSTYIPSAHILLTKARALAKPKVRWTGKYYLPQGS